MAIHSPRAEEPEPTAPRRLRRRREGAAAAPAAAARRRDAAKKAEPAKKEEAKKEPQRKTPRSKRFSTVWQREGRRTGGPCFFRVAGECVWLVYRCALSSAWAIRDLNIWSPATTRASGSWICLRGVTAVSFAITASTRARPREGQHGRTRKSIC